MRNDYTTSVAVIHGFTVPKSLIVRVLTEAIVDEEQILWEVQRDPSIDGGAGIAQSVEDLKSDLEEAKRGFILADDDLSEAGWLAMERELCNP